jgi:hypothetical protein
MVDAGQNGDYGGNLFYNNDCDIQYTNKASNPPWINAIGNCWDDEYGSPDFCGKWDDRIYWDPPDCSGWGGFGAPPRHEEPIMTGVSRVFPNPLEDGIRIEFGIPEVEISPDGGIHVALRIYDLTGRLVRELAQSDTAPGLYSVDWDGRDDSGQTVSAGMYICRLETDKLVDSRRIVLTR